MARVGSDGAGVVACGGVLKYPSRYLQKIRIAKRDCNSSVPFLNERWRDTPEQSVLPFYPITLGARVYHPVLYLLRTKIPVWVKL